ncbi:MAG: serine acetyltransferase [Paludibacteraceae bacterium]|nr:serine acetyltransferase [Paludibacteraceae bacterium]MBO7635750.1 serine acetyltransferase [Paludibacteraceae bacterium]MBR5973109.1 serine acetyltransferase [Paludibacteraceae bacterium]
MLSVVSRLSEYDSLRKVYHQKRDGETFPSSEALHEVVNLTRSIIFPGYYGDSSVDLSTLQYYIGVSVDKLTTVLQEQILSGFLFGSSSETEYEQLKLKSQELANRFVANLPSLRDTLVCDVEAAYYGDPAAKSFSEIIFCYPAVKAISNYRIAHELLTYGVPLIPRMITEMAHSETGIDIHPGATIGKYFTIDHGTGVVIGETCIIGEHVKIYQGVTLGAKSFQLDEQGNPVKNIERHPIIEDNVVIYANATILGRITIGRDSIIGGNVCVTSDVSPCTKIVQPHSNL